MSTELEIDFPEIMCLKHPKKYWHLLRTHLHKFFHDTTTWSHHTLYISKPIKSYFLQLYQGQFFKDTSSKKIKALRFYCFKAPKNVFGDESSSHRWDQPAWGMLLSFCSEQLNVNLKMLPKHAHTHCVAVLLAF